MNYLEPVSRKELHWFLSMVNKFGAWVKDLQPNIINLNNMTSEKSLFYWREIHTEEFEKCK